MRPGYQVRELG